MCNKAAHNRQLVPCVAALVNNHSVRALYAPRRARRAAVFDLSRFRAMDNRQFLPADHSSSSVDGAREQDNRVKEQADEAETRRRRQY